ncbi:Hsp33 family molecular chaperone HslO [Oceanispirochaeta sp.]|jgi:molecular chaperone Hsp33|uniref:Hsp33 family molecular chaperone HslO n=1 Tax=Oceanispirochaeta sp. TaxID=2035350 RepID=UPI002637FF5A|nr:Hsp33 family molecular chaperone HslO [Oceanispirochaeta sp.]MDA3956029.1 Hsp33 family molecular chaperone HslO [Oceanispirochaeta sp.]
MIKKPIPGDTKKSMLKARSRDRRYHFVMAGGAVRGVLIQGSRMLREMQLNHNLGVLESIVLGQAYLGTALIASGLKEDGLIQFKVECGGPLKGLSVEADSHGTVRGFLMENPIPLERVPETLDTSLLFGPGFLSVTRYTGDLNKAFTGQVELRSGRLAEDLAAYYEESEQIHTVFNLSVHLETTGEVSGGAALFLQAMPGADEHVLDMVQDAILEIPSLSRTFTAEMDVHEFLDTYLADFQPDLLADKRVEFMCGCSKSRFEKFLANLSPAEQKEIVDNGPFPVITTCHNCNTSYDFSRNELESLFKLG